MHANDVTARTHAAASRRVLGNRVEARFERSGELCRRRKMFDSPIHKHGTPATL